MIGSSRKARGCESSVLGMVIAQNWSERQIPPGPGKSETLEWYL